MNCGWEIPVLAGSIKATRSGSKIMRLKVEKGYFGRKKAKKKQKQEMRKELSELVGGHYSLLLPYHYLHSDGDLPTHLR